MRCDDFLPLIEKLADGEATAAERDRTKAHLESCTSCQSHFRFLKALPEAARQASLPAPPDMYWDVLPRKIMSRIEKESSQGRGAWFSRWLAPSRLRWAGALAGALMAAVLGLRVFEFPLADRDAPSVASVTRPNEDEREATIARQSAPASPAKQEDVMNEKPAGVSAAPEAAREEFATGVLSAPGKAAQKKQDDASEAAARRGIGGRGGRLEQDLDDLKSTQPNERNRDKGKARSVIPEELANVAEADAQEVQEAIPAAAAPPADRDLAAQTVSVSRTLSAQPALEEASSSAEQDYRNLVTRYPIKDEPQKRSSSLSGVAKEKEGAFSDAELETECDDWRQFLARYPGNERETDVRYRLALCSIEIFEISPSDENRRRAVVEGTSYLDVAADEKRAEAIRRALVRIRP